MIDYKMVLLFFLKIWFSFIEGFVSLRKKSMYVFVNLGFYSIIEVLKVWLLVKRELLLCLGISKCYFC